MSYLNTNSKNLWTRVTAIMLLAGLSIWKFYQFAIFEDQPGITDGSIHLWWAIALATLACIAGVFAFSSFLRGDTSNELHITAPRRATRS